MESRRPYGFPLGSHQRQTVLQAGRQGTETRPGASNGKAGAAGFEVGRCASVVSPRGVVAASVVGRSLGVGGNRARLARWQGSRALAGCEGVVCVGRVWEACGGVSAGHCTPAHCTDGQRPADKSGALALLHE